MVPTQRLYQSRQVGTRWLEQIFRAQDRVQMAATQAEGGGATSLDTQFRGDGQ